MPDRFFRIPVVVRVAAVVVAVPGVVGGAGVVASVVVVGGVLVGDVGTVLPAAFDDCGGGAGIFVLLLLLLLLVGIFAGERVGVGHGCDLVAVENG